MCAASEHADPLRSPSAVPGSAAGLRHAALVYKTADDFLAVTVPFLLEGVARQERTLALADPATAAALTDALGDAAQQVDLQPADAWLAGNPWRALVAFRRYLEEHTAGGRRVRIVGEPFALPRSAAGTSDWTRYEALVNDAFASFPASLLCGYDAGTLDPQVVAHAACTHPTLVDSTGRPRPSDEYADARALSAALDATPLAAAPHAAAARAIDPPTSLHELRGFVTERARAAGLADERAADLTFAAHELTVNAREHGGGAGTLRTWIADGEFVCEVADGGSGLRNPLAGTAEPLPLQPDGRGLWLARQLCDLVQVRSTVAGTVVRLHMALA